jgi:cytochrome P450
MKNIRYRHIQALVGQGLLLSEAAEWRRQRVITQPAFKPDTLDAQVGWMGEHTERFLDRWKTLADRGATFDVEPDFNRLAQLLSGRFLLGEPFAEIADEFCDIAAYVKRHWPAQARNLVRAFMKPDPKKIALFDAAIARLDACLLGFVQRHRATDYEGCGVLTRIVRTSREEGNLFDDKSLRDQLSTMFFAGHETSCPPCFSPGTRPRPRACAGSIGRCRTIRRCAPGSTRKWPASRAASPVRRTFTSCSTRSR